MPPTNLAQKILAPISNVRRPKTSSSNLRHSFRRRKRKPSTSTSLLKSSSHSKLGRFCTDFHANSPKKRARLQNRAIAFNFRRLRVSCEVKDSDNRSNGEEPPESLFMKELKRRGMTPASLGEEKNVSTDRDGDVKFSEDDRGWSYSRRNEITIDVGIEVSNQREKSMALNSEGLEGLIPRAKLLLTLGGTFFLAFWPLILVTVASSSALYLYFGPEFVYDGSKTPIRPPPYVDPYALLEEERIYKTAPHLN